MRKENSTNALNEKRINGHCHMAYTLSLIGGRWKPGILWELVHKGSARYSDLKKSLNGISERVLASQLKELEADKLIRRTVYAEVPPRVEYELTDEGRSMKSMLESMSDWGKAHRKENDPQADSHD